MWAQGKSAAEALREVEVATEAAVAVLHETGARLFRSGLQAGYLCRRPQTRRGLTMDDDEPYSTMANQGEIGFVRVGQDFLPPPDQLVLRDEGLKVTLTLSRRSVDFFKQEAARRHVPYQRMIRALVDAYARRHRSVERTSTVIVILGGVSSTYPPRFSFVLPLSILHIN